MMGVDMSEFMERHTVSQPPPAYVGYTEAFTQSYSLMMTRITLTTLSTPW